MVDYKDMGARIRKRRREMKLTQEKLAEQVNLSTSYMGHIERGTRTASLETMMELCHVLQVTPNALLKGSLDIINLGGEEPLSKKQRQSINALLRLAQEAVLLEEEEEDEEDVD